MIVWNTTKYFYEADRQAHLMFRLYHVDVWSSCFFIIYYYIHETKDLITLCVYIFMNFSLKKQNHYI